MNMSQHHHIVWNAQCDLGKRGVFFCRNFHFYLRMLHQNGSICVHLLRVILFNAFVHYKLLERLLGILQGRKQSTTKRVDLPLKQRIEDLEGCT